MANDPRSTRRAFVARVARKTVYVAPAVMALNAARRAAADYTGCQGPNSPCTMGSDCCNFVGPMSCEQSPGVSCMGAPDCTCDPDL